MRQAIIYCLPHILLQNNLPYIGVFVNFMEVIFSQLKQKDVISVTDGKNLGKVCDLSMCYPENIVSGLTVTGGKGFRLTKQDMFIPMKNVQSIGEDAVLVKLDPPQKEEVRCPPQKQPKRPPNECRHDNSPCRPCPPDRRSYEEYE